LGYFCNFQKNLPKVNNRPLGENSPNPVTLGNRAYFKSRTQVSACLLTKLAEVAFAYEDLLGDVGVHRPLADAHVAQRLRHELAVLAPQRAVRENHAWDRIFTTLYFGRPGGMV
jgi:hypothetical protein